MKKQVKSKVSKSVTKKSSPMRKPVTKKAVVTKKKPIVSKKLINKKKTLKIKKLGIFAIISGTVAAVVLAFIALSAISSLQATSVSDNSVLGWSFTSKFAAPSGLTATTVDSHVTLSWKSVPKAIGYNIYRSTSLIGGMKKVAFGSFGNLTYIDNSTTPSKNYRYSVSAFDGFKESSKSAAKSIKASSRVMPIKPTIVGYDGGGDMLFAGVVWNYQPFVTGYYMYCDKCANTKITVRADDSYTDAEFGELMHKEFDVVSGTKYTIQISAYRTIDGKTTESAKSTVVAFTGGSSESVWPPAKPTGLKYSGTYTDHTVAEVLWNVPAQSATRSVAISGYYLYCNNCATKKVGVSKDAIVSSTSGPQMYGELGVVAGQNYTIQVSAYGKVGSTIYESAKSAALSFNSTTTEVTGPPIPPLNFQIMNLTATTIVFQFKSRHNAGGGDYLYCEQCTVSKMEINSANLTQAYGSDGSAPDGSETWILSGLTPGKPYHLKLSSYNAYNGVKMESLFTDTKYVGTLPY